MVVPLEKALYGHPNAGAYWERRCNAAITEAGFVQVGEAGEWRSCFYHAEHEVFLMVYVDDFKMAGPSEKVDLCWELVQKPMGELGKAMLELEDVTEVDNFLGCRHIKEEIITKDGTTVQAHIYDMQQFMLQCVEAYEKLADRASSAEKRTHRSWKRTTRRTRPSLWHPPPTRDRRVHMPRVHRGIRRI